MRRKLFRVAILGAALAMWALLQPGCIFSPAKSPPGTIKPPPPPVYPELTYPEQVLDALQIAYSHRDSVFTKVLYDSSYAGYSEDLSDPTNPPPINFTYFNEVDHVARLAREPTISSVTMNFGPPTTWNRYSSDDPSHPEWAVVQITGTFVTVSVLDGLNEYRVSSPAEFFEYKFQPTLDSTSPSDTLWKIVRWKETKFP